MIKIGIPTALMLAHSRGMAPVTADLRQVAVLIRVVAAPDLLPAHLAPLEARPQTLVIKLTAAPVKVAVLVAAMDEAESLASNTEALAVITKSPIRCLRGSRSSPYSPIPSRTCRRQQRNKWLGQCRYSGQP